MTTLDGPVGIVGAGPVGLVTALRLASFGVRSVLLESSPELVRQGSKACLIQGDVLEILDKVGCAQTIADEGVTWTTARTYVHDKVIRTAVYPRGLGFGPFVNISQYRIEQVLATAAEAEPLCDLRWGHTVTGATADSDGITVRARTATGEQELRLSYLVACDGVRSTLRELVGVAWTGYTHQDRFLITDIRAKLPLARERHFHYDPACNPGRQLVMHPQPDDIWRIDWQLPPDADIDQELASGAFDRRVRAVIGDIPYEVDWVSTYRFHQRVVAQLRVGRILFAGDAAHALPPYGSRGMNSGIQDADNLAWKLALVLAGQASDELLETYHMERYAAAQENLRVTEATIRFMVPPTRLRRLLRSVLLRLSHPVRSMRRHVNSGRMAEPYVYTDSPLVLASAGNPLMGAFAPDAWVVLAGRRTRLRRLLGSGFVVLYFADNPSEVPDIAEWVRARPTAVPVALVVVLPPANGDSPAGEASMAEGVTEGVTVVRESAPAVPGHRPTDDSPPGYDRSAEPGAALGHGPTVRETYRVGAGQWWLVRPDGHLAAHGARPDDLADVLLTAIGGVLPRRSVLSER